VVGIFQTERDIRMEATLQNGNRIFIRSRNNSGRGLDEQIKTLLGEAGEDIILALEVAIDRRGRIANPLCQTAQGEALIPILDKAFPRGSEDQAPDLRFVLFAYTLDVHSK